MVQPKYSPMEALERAKLLMKYDTKKTLTENVILIEASNPPNYNYSSALEVLQQPATGSDYTKIPPPPGAKQNVEYYINNRTREIKFWDGSKYNPDGTPKPKNKKRVRIGSGTMTELEDFYKNFKKNCLMGGIKPKGFFSLVKGATIGALSCTTQALLAYGGAKYAYDQVLWDDTEEFFRKLVYPCNQGVHKITPKTLEDNAPDTPEIQVNPGPTPSDETVNLVKKGLNSRITDLAALGIAYDYEALVPSALGVKELWREYNPLSSNPQSGVFNQTSGRVRTYNEFCAVVDSYNKSSKYNFVERVVDVLNDSELDTLTTFISGLIQKAIAGEVFSNPTEGCPTDKNAIQTHYLDMPDWVRKNPCLFAGAQSRHNKGKVNCIGNFAGKEYLYMDVEGTDRSLYIFKDGTVRDVKANEMKKWSCEGQGKAEIIMEHKKLVGNLISEQVKEKKKSDPEKKKTAEPSKPKPFCPDGYKSCTVTYFKCCKSPRIRVLQECLGMANPDGNWDEYTQRTIEGAYPQYKNTINDDQINKICEYSPDDFCINGYKDCVNEYRKCCVSPKILELKKCLNFQTTTSDKWGALTDAELTEKHPKLKFGFNDEDVRQICHPAKGRGFVDPSNLDF